MSVELGTEARPCSHKCLAALTHQTGQFTDSISPNSMVLEAGVVATTVTVEQE